MIIKNFKIAIRILISHSKFTLINILGLAIGLACFILITIWVQDELSFDNFHEDADNVHIVFRKEDGKRSGVSSKLLAPALKEELPEVLEATCFRQLPEAFSILFEYKENSFVERIAMADNQFLKVFSFPLLKGDPSTAFSDPNSVVITERMSQKYFGGEEALGKTFSVTAFGQKKLLTVSGVLKNIPHNSHIQSELILPIEFMNYFGAEWDVWGNYSVSTYIRTQDNISSTQLEEKILACKEGHFSQENLSYSVLPITKIHLNTSDVGFFTTKGDIKYVYIFSAIAAIILLIASMNYMNLSNALSLKRSKEIGIRKTLGSMRIQVIQQYFGETLILVFIALIFAILLVQICLPVLNYLSLKSLTVPYTNPQFILTLLGIIVSTSLISGIYPAIFVSGFQPIKVLKGKFVSSTQSINIRKGLVVFQFVLSILIVIVTITVFNQLRFIQSIDLGYDKEHVVCVTIKEDISNKYEAFKSEMLQSGNVLNVSRSENMQATGMSSTQGVDWPGKQQKFNTWVLDVDDEFAETYGIKMNDGRFYSRDFATDLTKGFVINQTAANEMGFENPIGQELTMWGRKGTIIGVTNDFHFSSLHHKIEPLIFHIPEPENVNRSYRVISMRIKPNSMPQSLDYIKKTWKTYFPNENIEYYFMDEKLKANYVSEARMGTLFKYFSLLVIFIACLGLYGLTAFTIEQKKKEIGIRKVNGAKVSEILTRLNKDFIKWVAIAFVIAAPIAYYAMNKWLENFAYKTTLSWWIFISAGVLALAVALITVSWQTFKAARRNPVEALRYE